LNSTSVHVGFNFFTNIIIDNDIIEIIDHIGGLIQY